MREGKVFGFENLGGQPGIVDRFLFVLCLIAELDGFMDGCHVFPSRIHQKSSSGDFGMQL